MEKNKAGKYKEQLYHCMLKEQNDGEKQSTKLKNVF